MMIKDIYDEILNGDETFKSIATILKEGKNVLIGWTDGEYDHRDIFFSYNTTEKYGNIQRGIKQNYLFVGIIDFSFYGFNIDSTKHYSYILEKLQLDENSTNIEICNLINGIIEQLNNVD